MKLSENTLAVLKNFQSINNGIVLNPGNVIRTLSLGNGILATARIAEEIPSQFAIFELQSFLSNIGHLGGKEADLEFDDSRVKITSNEGLSIVYHGAEPSLIHAPKSDYKVDFDFEFNLENAAFQKIIKLANLNNFEKLTFIGQEEELLIKVSNPENGNVGQYNVGKNSFGKNFEAPFKVEMLKILPLDYVVQISLKGVAKFTSVDGNLSYYVVMNIKK